MVDVKKFTDLIILEEEIEYPMHAKTCWYIWMDEVEFFGVFWWQRWNFVAALTKYP